MQPRHLCRRLEEKGLVDGLCFTTALACQHLCKCRLHDALLRVVELLPAIRALYRDEHRHDLLDAKGLAKREISLLRDLLGRVVAHSDAALAKQRPQLGNRELVGRARESQRREQAATVTAALEAEQRPIDWSARRGGSERVLVDLLPALFLPRGDRLLHLALDRLLVWHGGTDNCGRVSVRRKSFGRDGHLKFTSLLLPNPSKPP